MTEQREGAAQLDLIYLDPGGESRLATAHRKLSDGAGQAGRDQVLL